MWLNKELCSAEMLEMIICLLHHLFFFLYFGKLFLVNVFFVKLSTAYDKSLASYANIFAGPDICPPPPQKKKKSDVADETS